MSRVRSQCVCVACETPVVHQHLVGSRCALTIDNPAAVVVNNSPFCSLVRSLFLFGISATVSDVPSARSSCKTTTRRDDDDEQLRRAKQSNARRSPLHFPLFPPFRIFTYFYALSYFIFPLFLFSTYFYALSYFRFNFPL